MSIGGWVRPRSHVGIFIFKPECVGAMLIPINGQGQVDWSTARHVPEGMTESSLRMKLFDTCVGSLRSAARTCGHHPQPEIPLGHGTMSS